MRRALLTAGSAPPDPLLGISIGDAVLGGYYVGIIDTTTGNIISADASQTGLRYALIVSPKSLEQTTFFWRTSQGPGPAASRTRWDGLSATASMASSTYPAANYCAGLAYPDDDASKWYLPALDELELIYRNLKSTTEKNSTGSRSDAEFPTGTVFYGQNPSSSPTAAAYTGTAPGQTAVAMFRDGGGQNLGRSGQYDYYWTATEWNAATYAWGQALSGTSAGLPSTGSKDTSNFVRPVRRLTVT